MWTKEKWPDHQRRHAEKFHIVVKSLQNIPWLGYFMPTTVVQSEMQLIKWMSGLSGKNESIYKIAYILAPSVSQQ